MSVLPAPPNQLAAVTEPVTIPDLLHPTPWRRIDEAQTKLSIALAFAGGVSGGLVSDALDNARIAPSSWDPSSFVNDLFLPQFVALCLKVRTGENGLAKAPGVPQPSHISATHLAKLIAHPPSDVTTVHHRRAILAELLAVPSLRAELERLYLAMGRFRTLLEGQTGVGKWDANRRQLDILQLVKEIIDCTAEGFLSARSGLSRLTGFGKRIQESEPYRSLADLLRYDEQLATLSLEVRVGADGRIRGFEVLKIQEDVKNPFVSSPMRRWLAKLELFVRGFKFSDGEVMARLIDAVFEGIEPEILSFIQLFGDLEFYLGALGFHDFAKNAGLAVCLPELTTPQAPRVLSGLFNPLLLAHGITPVPCEVRTDRHATTVLVTGPNSGGKTRLLQSVALTQLLAQAGMFVPARSGSLALASGLVVSLIEEQKADQTEGRLGTELHRIRQLFERLPPNAMVILDELCSGTNPSEGEEIFELVVEILTKLSPQAFITTHFLAFAARLERERNISDLRFLQVELGADQKATYQFTPGVAQTSLAAHAASRLGVTRDQLLALIDRNTRRSSEKK